MTLVGDRHSDETRAIVHDQMVPQSSIPVLLSGQQELLPLTLSQLPSLVVSQL